MVVVTDNGKKEWGGEKRGLTHRSCLSLDWTGKKNQAKNETGREGTSRSWNQLQKKQEREGKKKVFP